MTNGTCLVYLRANGIVLNIEVRGRGEPVVLISDIGEDLTSWSFQAPSFGGLHFLVQLDNRGSGWSDCPDNGYSIDAMAQDVICMMDLVGVDKAHLVGLGLGGMIAQEIALKRPGRVGGLVLVSSSNHTTAEQKKGYMDWLQATQEGHDPLSISRSMTALLHSSWFLENERWREYVIRGRAACYRYLSWAGATQQLEAMLDYNSSDRLSRISSPTLVLSGIEDHLVPSSNARELSDAIKESRHSELAAGHLLQVELPRTFNNEVLGFLAEVEGSPLPDQGSGMPIPWGCMRGF